MDKRKLGTSPVELSVITFGAWGIGKPLADAKKATISQPGIKWTIQQPGITIVLVGARNSQQAIENASACKINLSIEDFHLIDTELAKLN